MKISLLGPPSSGKGTIGKILSEKVNVPLIGMGKMLRELTDDHPKYAEVDEIMDSGGLAPNDLVSHLLKERLQQEDCANGYVIDGYPRDYEQIDLFAPNIDKAFLLMVSIDTIYKRVTGRRICEETDEVYNIYTLPEEEIDCDGELIQRDDDTKEALIKRLQVYLTQTVEVNDYYRNEGLLVEVDAEPLPETIADTILSIIENDD